MKRTEATLLGEGKEKEVNAIFKHLRGCQMEEALVWFWITLRVEAGLIGRSFGQVCLSSIQARTFELSVQCGDGRAISVAGRNVSSQALTSDLLLCSKGGHSTRSSTGISLAQLHPPLPPWPMTNTGLWFRGVTRITSDYLYESAY